MRAEFSDRLRTMRPAPSLAVPALVRSLHAPEPKAEVRSNVLAALSNIAEAEAGGDWREARQVPRRAASRKAVPALIEAVKANSISLIDIDSVLERTLSDAIPRLASL